jgi:hypothetical protein
MTSANADTVRDSASDALDQLQRAGAPPIREGQRQAGVLLDRSADLGKSLIAYTKKNPITALAVAVGAGALLVSAAKSLRSRR